MNDGSADRSYPELRAPFEEAGRTGARVVSEHAAGTCRSCRHRVPVKAVDHDYCSLREIAISADRPACRLYAERDW